MQTHRLMAVLAHPDDESLGIGGALAKYASEGVEVSLVTATRGDLFPGHGPNRCRYSLDEIKAFTISAAM